MSGPFKEVLVVLHPVLSDHFSDVDFTQ